MMDPEKEKEELRTFSSVLAFVHGFLSPFHLLPAYWLNQTACASPPHLHLLTFLSIIRFI